MSILLLQVGIIAFNNYGDGIEKNCVNMNNNLVAENPRLLAQCEVWSRQRRPQRSRGLRGEQRGGVCQMW